MDKKSRYIEEFKLKVSKESVKKVNVTHRKTNSEIGSLTLRNNLQTIADKAHDLSTSRFNTSMFQEMSSKFGMVFSKVGKALGVKKEDGIPNQILSSDFLRELDLQQSTPASLNSSVVQSNHPSQFALNNKTKGHGRNLSSISHFAFK